MNRKAVLACWPVLRYDALAVHRSSYISISRNAPISSVVNDRRRQSGLGVIIMLCAMFMFAGSDVLAKLLTEDIHPVQIIWFRQLGLLFGMFILLGLKGPTILQTKQLSTQICRGILVIASSLLFVFALRHVALAHAIAASFVSPFFATLLGAVILNERVHPKQWIAITIGFIGALIVVRPGMGAVHPAVMLVLVAAALFGSRQVIGRLLADTDKATTTIAYSAITSSILISIPLPLVWTWPPSDTVWIYLVAMAALAAVGEVFVIKSLEVAEASIVAPIHYTILIWGTIYGFFIFNDLPDSWTIIGSIIIISAGLYSLRVSRH